MYGGGSELFIDWKQGLYIHNGDKETDQEKYLTSWKSVKLKRREN